MFCFLINLIYCYVDDQRCIAPTRIAEEPPKNYSLFHVQIITRHGQRTPLYALLPYENRGRWICDADDAISQREEANPNVFYRRYKVVYDDETSFPGNCNVGDLIIEGMRQHENLGKSYRQRFVNETKFLPESFDPQYFYFTSSYIERTFRSQEAFIVGLYPIRSNNEVIVVEMAGESHSPLFPNTGMCADQKKQSDEYLASDAYSNLSSYYDVLKDGLDAVSLSSSISDINKFCEWAIATNCKAENSPSFLTQSIIDSCHSVLANGQFVRYSVGERGIAASYILREMLYILDKRIEGKTNVKFAHFSAHDTSLAAILVALVPNQRFNNIPPYASHVTSEVYKGPNGKLYIRYLYNGEIVKIDGTDSYGLMSYDEFRKLVDPFLQFCQDVPLPTD